jgi:hypothetical protein
MGRVFWLQFKGDNVGVSWVILTNAETWMLYKIKFGKPIEKELVSEFNLLNINPKTEKDLEPLFVVSKDGQEKSVIDDFYSSILVKNKFIIGALLNSPDVHSLIRRIMKKLFGDVKISEEEIADIMANDIVKREIIDSDESKKAKKDIDKLVKKLERIREKNSAAASPKSGSGPEGEEAGIAGDEDAEPSEGIPDAV